jgi:preprotein translocase subunit SecE
MAETTTTPTTQGSWMDRMREFVKDVRLESTKVSWPTRNELRDSTIVVIIAVILVSIFVGVIDRVLTFLMGLIIR